MCLHSSVFLKKITEFIMSFDCQYLTCSFVWYSVDIGPEVIWHVCTYTILFASTLSVLACGAAARVSGFYIFCELNFMLSCGLLITSHIIFSIFRSSKYGFPSNAGPSPSTTKNPHLTSLSLYLHLIVHIHNYSILDWLYVFSMTELFSLASKATVVD